MAIENPLEILIVDDEPINRESMHQVLEFMGYEADLAGDGIEALEALKHRSYDCILMDVKMPKMDGISATRRIRSEWPEDRQPWIIAVTAEIAAERRDYLSMGMDDLVSKPVDIGDLIRALGNARRIGRK